MRTLLKLVGVLAALAALAGAGGIGYLLAAYPDVPPAQAVTLPATPEALARGEYLARHVAACVSCHSGRDYRRFAAPLLDGTIGRGGERVDGPTSGVPGTLYAPNITPSGVGGDSDAELFSAVTTGVARDGRAMFH